MTKGREHIVIGYRRTIGAISSVAAFILVLSALPVSAAGATSAYGSDGSAPIAIGSAGAYVEPTCSPTTNYDTYTAEVGAAIGGGHTIYIAPSTGSSTDQLYNIDRAHNMYANGHGVGAGAYFFLGGPKWASGGETTNINAYIWGEDQAIITIDDYNAANAAAAGDFSNLFIMADTEVSTSNNYGWDLSNETMNLEVILGYIFYLQNAGVNVGVYASPSFWANYMGSTSLAQAEWTSENDYGPVTPCPTGTLSGGPGGTSASYFGGVTPSSNNALGWQWSIAGGDYDQYDLSHYGALFGITVNR